jgi:hypothetical protein
MFNYEDIKKESATVIFLLDACYTYCGTYLKLLSAGSGPCNPAAAGRNDTEVRRQFPVGTGAVQGGRFKNCYQEHHVYE